MKDYYALIRRSDFIDLFKYGQFHLNKKTVVCASGKYSNGKEDIVASLFENANLFESSFTYLIIKFVSEDLDADNHIVSIENVTNIYPLDLEAKSEFEITFNDHIKIDEPIWSNSYAKIQRQMAKLDCKKGVENVWRIFKLETQISECENIITDRILDEVIAELYENRRPSGELSIWIYLLRYERHAYYPQEIVGYFMDVVNVVCNYVKHKEVDETNVSRTEIWSFLDKLPRNYEMNDIFNAIENSNETKPFTSKVPKIEGGVEFINVAVAFLMLKNRYSNGLRYESEVIEKLTKNKNTCKYFGLIFYLLGLVLGYDKTYDCLYENLPLKIYKGESEMEAIRRKQENEKKKANEERKRMGEERQLKKSKSYRGKEDSMENPNKLVDNSNPNNYGGGQKPLNCRKEPKYEENKKASETGSKINTVESSVQSTLQAEGTLFPDDYDKPLIPNFPCLMGKLKRGSSTKTCKTPKPKEVTTREEYENLFSKGWRIITTTDQ